MVSSTTSHKFINFLIENDYMVWNLGIPKAEKAPKLQKGVGWSTAMLEDVKPYLNYKSNSWGMRTGLQPNGKYIIALDFDLWVKINNNYEECHNTRKLYKEFELLNDVKDGLFSSSTENNKGCLVDITNCHSLIELIELDARNKIQKQNYCLEVLCGANLALPPTTTTCKINNKKLYPRAFLSEQYFLELKEGSDIYNFIYKYIDDGKLTNKVSAKYITKYNKKVNYINLIDNIEEDKLEMESKYIEPFLKLLSKDRISNYSTWRNIGLALKNICSNEEGFKLFNLVSSFSKNYEPNGVIKSWNSWDNYVNKYDGLNHNYILRCANNDNPDKFYITYIEYLENTKEAKYKNKLAEFEKEVKYIIHPPMYMAYNEYLNKWNRYDSSDLIKIYKIKYGKEFIKCYLDDEEINYYTNMDFIPDINFNNPKIYNTFNGFNIDKISEPQIVNCDIIKNHIANVCNNDNNTIEFFTQWLAHLIFNTTKRCGIVPVIQAKQGSGKGTLYNIIEKIIGRKYCLMTSTPENDIFSKFNDLLHEKVLININEAELNNFSKTMETFKSLITDNTYNMESKGLRKLELNNYMWFLITTNNEKLFNVSSDDRRFYFIKSNNEIKNNREYFNNLYSAIDDNNIIYSFYKYLESIYNPNYNFYKKKQEYKTEYHKVLEEVSKHPFYTFLNEWISTQDEEVVYITSENLISVYEVYCDKNKLVCYENAKSIKQKLMIYKKDVYKKTRKGPDGNRWYYILDKQEFTNYMKNEGLI